jgi:hypothetical protein
MYYFGTNLGDAGHFFWILYDDIMEYMGHKQFSKIPFNPEELTNGFKRGEHRVMQIGDYTVWVIEGSPADKRPGSKSIFFVKEKLSNVEMIQRVASISIARKLIAALPVPPTDEEEKKVKEWSGTFSREEMNDAVLQACAGVIAGQLKSVADVQTWFDKIY